MPATDDLRPICAECLVAPENRVASSPGADEGLMARVMLLPRIGPAELGTLGCWITVRCPRDLAPVMRQAGGMWDPGNRRRPIERRRIGAVLRTLRHTTDPLLRRTGVDLGKG